MNIHDVRLYKGKPVLIIDGAYMGTYGISNFWDFRYIKKDGTLGKYGSDYDNGPFSENPLKCRITTIVKL